MLRVIKKFLLDLVFPNQCLNCKVEGELLCSNCLKTLPIFNILVCPICHKRLTGENPTQWKCKIHGNKSKLRFVAYSTSYDYPLAKKIIGTFKYRSIKDLSEILSYPMIENLKASRLSDFLLIPVPLHKAKIKERNFNQAELIARKIAQETELSYVNVLVKIKKTKSQTELNFDQRQNNVKGAFGCENPKVVKNKNVILVDDVLTTGATLEECAKVLKQNGAKTIGAVVFAK